MIAAGFGDMLCKFSAVADWRLGALLWGESFDEAIARRSTAAAESASKRRAQWRRRPEGLAALMAALVQSGLCMAEAGHSRPASGAEHHYSHFWEMRLLPRGKGSDFARAKSRHRDARDGEALGRGQAADDGSGGRAPRGFVAPSRADEEARIRRAFGDGPTGSSRPTSDSCRWVRGTTRMH